MPSPILPCGCLCSLPIPYTKSDVPYSHIHFGKRTLQEIRTLLNSESPIERAHLDPDLRHDALVQRPKDWRPAFGQSGAAGGLLINQDIKRGDLFIFFGWFRRTIFSDRKLVFDAADRHGRHMAFGWLEVGEVVNELPLPPNLSFLIDHPHVQFFEQEGVNNRIFVSSKTGLKAGLFATESESIVLTQNGRARTQWSLDKAFESLIPTRERCELTYHGKEWRWGREGKKVTLRAVSRGQEFVFDGNRHLMAKKYFVQKVRKAMSNEARRCPHDF